MTKTITRQELNPLLDSLIRGKITGIEFGNRTAENAQGLFRIVTVKATTGSKFAIKFLYNKELSLSGIYFTDCDKDELVERLNILIQRYSNVAQCDFYMA